MRNIHGQSGFTIIELMLTIVVASLLIGIGVPSMRNMLLTQDVKTAASDLHLTMMYARSEAIKRRVNVEIDPKTTWAGGWEVKASGVASVLRDREPLTGMTVNVTGIGAGDSVTFNKLGRIAGASPVFNVYVNGNNAVRMRCVSLSLSGRPSVATDWDGDYTDGVCD